MNIEEATVAELLKSARLEQKLTIKAVAGEICVRSSYLIAIEEADYDELPGQIFAIGFVKSYATVLGLDAQKIVASFKSEYCPELTDLAKLSLANNAAAISAKAPRKTSGWLMSLLGLAGISASWALLGGGFGTALMTADAFIDDVAIEEAQLAAVKANINQSLTNIVQTVSLKMVETDTVVEQAVETAGTETAPVLVAASEKLQQARSFFASAVYADVEASTEVAGNFRLEAVKDSWVRLAHTDGTEVWSGILRAGQSYRPQADGVILLSTSNAGGVALQVGTAEPVMLGRRGEIVSELRLEENLLLTAQN